MTGLDRANALFKVAAHPGQQVRERLIQCLSDSDALVRHVAAVELAQRWPNDLPGTSIHELLDTLARLEYLYKERLPIEVDYTAATATDEGGGDLGNDIVSAFTHLACGQADFVIPRLLEFWSFDPQQYDFGHALLALAFQRTPEPVVGTSLTGVQRRILQASIRQEGIWSGDAFWPSALAAHGLLGTNEGVRRLLGYTW